jgi:predicted deacylase
MEIGGQLIEPGQHKTPRVEIARLPTGTVIDMRVHVFRAKRPGPVLLLQGGLHGDEVGGVEILRRMLSARAFDGLRSGTVIVVPILNVFGFIHFSREVPDGKDINRSFPGKRTGSLASRVAWHYREEVMRWVDVGIDFHTGGARRSNYPQIRYTPDHDESFELASAFAAPFVLPSGLIRKSFRKAAYDRDIPVIVYEGGESLRIDEFAVHEGMAGALRVMGHLGLIPRRRVPRAHGSEYLQSSRWLRATRAGMFHPVVENGAYVEAGEVVGTIGDAYGRSERTVSTRDAGHVICVNRLPVVNRGDALVHVAID